MSSFFQNWFQLHKLTKIYKIILLIETSNKESHKWFTIILEKQKQTKTCSCSSKLYKSMHLFQEIHVQCCRKNVWSYNHSNNGDSSFNIFFCFKVKIIMIFYPIGYLTICILTLNLTPISGGIQVKGQPYFCEDVLYSKSTAMFN